MITTLVVGYIEYVYDDIKEEYKKNIDMYKDILKEIIAGTTSLILMIILIYII